MSHKISIKERFDSKWMPEPNTSCWIWLANTSKDGYAIFSLNGKSVSGHKAALLLYKGFPINTTTAKNKMNWDHVCRNRSCVNPAHLRLLTKRENIFIGTGASARNKNKTYCKHGHLFDGDNIILTPHKYGIGRRCRACKRREAQIYSMKYRKLNPEKIKKAWIIWWKKNGELRNAKRRAATNLQASDSN